MAKQRDEHDSDWTGLGEEKRRSGFEWGLASLLMGGFLALMAPIMLISNIQLFQGAASLLGPTELWLANAAAIVGTIGVLALCITSIVFGVRGMRRAQWFDMPMGIPLAGVLISIAAVFIWVIVGVDLIMILQAPLRVIEYPV